MLFVLWNVLTVKCVGCAVKCVDCAVKCVGCAMECASVKWLAICSHVASQSIDSKFETNTRKTANPRA